MLFFVTASLAEATPLIQRYRLEKSTEPAPFLLYRGEGVRLAVSGRGKVRAALAVQRLLLERERDGSETVVHLGLCASTDPALALGAGVAAGKVADWGSGLSWYWEPESRAPFAETEITTLDRPGFPVENRKPMTGDLESAGVVQAASLFCPPERIFIVKAVARTMDGAGLEPGEAEAAISGLTDRLDRLLADRVGKRPEANRLPGTRETLNLEKMGSALKTDGARKAGLVNAAKVYQSGMQPPRAQVSPPPPSYSPEPVPEDSRTMAEIRKLLQGL